MHRYQRSDSVWANAFTTSLADHGVDFPRATHELLPAFVRVSCPGHDVSPIEPAEREPATRDASEFGDRWDEPLDLADLREVERYFRAVEHLARFLDFVRLRVGGDEHTIALGKRRFDRGVTFDVPRASLVAAVRYQVFDDLLIGNFMKTTLHGPWPGEKLFPDFTPYVTKYADNGGARSAGELERYFAEYRRRARFDHLRHLLERGSKAIFRSWVPESSPFYGFIKRAYWRAKGATA
jgi:hypothetical protein